MPSFQITTSPSRRAAARLVGDVRRALLRAFAVEGPHGLTQSEVARRLDVHRSVINRELRGTSDIGVGRIGELAWALGYEPIFELRKVAVAHGANSHPPGADVHRNAVSTVEVVQQPWPAGVATLAVSQTLQAVE